jgi:ubiquinone/menaquinone biosynthesis C-methylase UbiE
VRLLLRYRGWPLPITIALASRESKSSYYMASEDYSSVVAKHYAAYRPPLHRLVLSRVTREKESFHAGLDVGCGTGYSAVALADYCERVFGIDPNQPMLEQARAHPKITYISGTGDDLGAFPGESIDVVTFAGSLFYAKNEKLRTELIRVCKPGAALIAYDFEILLGRAMADLGFDLPPVNSAYDHAVNFSDWSEFCPETVRTERVSLQVSSEEFAHVMLADSNRLEVLSHRFQKAEPFLSLADFFESRGTRHQLAAEVYFSRYRLSPGERS